MRVTVHIPDILGPNLKRAAKAEGISLSGLAVKALAAYLKSQEKREAGTKLLSLIDSDAVACDVRDELDKARADDWS